MTKQRTLTPVAAIEALVAAADARGVTLNRVKVAKLLYLADLRAVTKRQAPFTGITWQWLQHGPFNNGIYPCFESLAGSGKIIQIDTVNYFGTEEVQYCATASASTEAAGEFLEHLEAVLSEHGAKTASELRDLTYQTAPMRKAQQGSRGVDLDLFAARGDAPSLMDVAKNMGEDEGFVEDPLDLPRWREDPQRPLMTVSRPLFRRA